MARRAISVKARRHLRAPLGWNASLPGGKCADEIAAALRLSPRTIRNQSRSAYEKLGARSLIEAMHRLGWVQVD